MTALRAARRSTLRMRHHDDKSHQVSTAATKDNSVEMGTLVPWAQARAPALAAMPRLPERGGLSTAKRRGLLQAVEKLEHKQEWKSLVMNRYGYIALGLIAGSQGMGATKLLLGSQGVAAAATGNFPVAIASLLGAMAASVAAELTESVTDSMMDAWIEKANDAFVHRLIVLNQDRPDAWSLDAYRKEIERWNGPLGQGVMGQAVGTIAAAARTSLGVVAQATAISCAVTPGMLPVLALSGGATFWYHSKRRGAREEGEKAAREAEGDLDEVRRALPDNVMLGNQHNRTVWKQKLAAAEAERDRAAGAVRRQMAMDGMVKTATSSLLPFGALAMFASAGGANMVHAMAAMPNLLSLLRFYNATLSVHASYQLMRSKMADMMERTQPGDMQAWNERLLHVEKNAGRFRITRDGHEVTLPAILAAPDILTTPARWTIRAPNGSGKSTLLRAIQCYFNDRETLYLPPASGLLFAGSAAGSTGQLACAEIQECGDLGRAEMLLLDEWDAHLDPDNKKKMSAMIDVWSRECAIIEVRQEVEAPQVQKTSDSN